jgi:hypothetical protein
MRGGYETVGWIDYQDRGQCEESVDAYKMTQAETGAGNGHVGNVVEKITRIRWRGDRANDGRVRGGSGRSRGRMLGWWLVLEGGAELDPGERL